MFFPFGQVPDPGLPAGFPGFSERYPPKSFFNFFETLRFPASRGHFLRVIAGCTRGIPGLFSHPYPPVSEAACTHQRGLSILRGHYRMLPCPLCHSTCRNGFPLPSPGGGLPPLPEGQASFSRHCALPTLFCQIHFRRQSASAVLSPRRGLHFPGFPAFSCRSVLRGWSAEKKGAEFRLQ